MHRAEVSVPAWVVAELRAQGIDELQASTALARALSRPLEGLLRTAAEGCIRELDLRAALRAARRTLEDTQKALKVQIGLPPEAETTTEAEPETMIPWLAGDPPSQDEVRLAAVLLKVEALGEIRAAMELNSWRASVHYENYELAHDNQVIGFHNAALRARAQGVRAEPENRA